MHYIELGPVPAEESCAQVGQPDFPERSRRECLVFRRMLQRLFPVPDGLQVQYVTRSHQHDYGTYREVAVGYSGNGTPAGASAAEDFAFAVERGTPSQWDPIAQYELAWFERRQVLARAVASGEIDACSLPEHYRDTVPPTLPAGSTFRELIEAYPL